MLRYVLRRLIGMLLTLWVIVTVTFVLMRTIPGDPFADEKALPPEILKAMHAHYGLDDPILIQYGRYLVQVVTWDLGPSFKYKARTVNDIINDGFPTSAVLGVEALLIAVGGGVLLGSVAAGQRGWVDRGAMLVAVIGISVPSFLLATLLQWIFAMQLGWLPVARWGSFAQSILPAISLAALPMAFIARLTRSNMLEVLATDYIRTAKARGAGSMRIITVHALRNALLPVATYLGQLVANVLVGSFVVERIFSIPGLGQWFVTSVGNRDYTVIMGVTVFYSALLLVTMLLVDLLYGWLDPRIQLHKESR